MYVCCLKIKNADLFVDRVSYYTTVWPQTYYGARAGLELVEILLP